MEKRTIFVHSTKDKLQCNKDDEYRVVTFISGNQNILDIIKKLIRDKYWIFFMIGI